MNTTLENKNRILNFFEAINTSKKENSDAIFNSYFSKNSTIHISKPFDKIASKESFSSHFWKPLLTSFPDLEIQPYIVMGGKSATKDCVAVGGNFIGTFKQDWLSIPASNQPTYIRFHAAIFLKNNKIDKAWFFLDILDVIRQAGFNLFPTKGLQQPAPNPMTEDGIINYSVDDNESLKSYNLTNAMIDGLLEFDGKTIDSMRQERFWDVKNMMWYGPGGIGTTRGLKGFQDHHQIPFLKAFPDRGVLEENKDAHFINIAEGNYTCHFGFPIMYGKHTGDGWLGIKATNKPFTMRVMDFWRRQGNKLKENWVMIDMIDVLEQFDINVFDLLKKKNE
ncbi:MAG: ester cyclase [Polaribacter sp.]